MKIQITFNNEEMNAFVKMVETMLDCGAKGGLKMNKSASEQAETISNLLVDGKFTKEFKPALVIKTFDRISKVMKRIGVWAAQTLSMMVDLNKLEKEFKEEDEKEKVQYEKPEVICDEHSQMSCTYFKQN